jgi:tetratricopeptide (TPR) repeat protein
VGFLRVSDFPFNNDPGMKKILFLLLFISSAAFAQPQDPAALHETAKGFLRQGDYENTILVLNRALQLDPNNLDMSKDLLFAYYLKRDFAKALEIGKPLVERPEADVPIYQTMGLVYKAVADNKEAEKLYKKGIKKFPNEGVLYSEYGDMIAEKESETALKLWEKGIELAPNHSSNYYFVSKLYAERGETLWSMLYGEIFLNMESFTPRATEVKNMLLEQYKKFFIAGNASASYNPKKVNDFTKAVAETLMLQQAQSAYGITPESLTAIRTRFILDWYAKYGDKLPFRLFEHQRQLLQEGLFEAYNFWLFGPAANLRTYQTWQTYHKQELDAYLAFSRSKVFKIPANQQYRVF